MVRTELSPADSRQGAVGEGRAAVGAFSSSPGVQAGCAGILEHSSPVGAIADLTPAALWTPWAGDGIANFRTAHLQEYP